LPTSLPSARTTTEQQVQLLWWHICSTAVAGCLRRMPWRQRVGPVAEAPFAMCMGRCMLPLACQLRGVAWLMHVAGPRVLRQGRCGALLRCSLNKSCAPQLACVMA
jgi:hypothetical protein